MINVTFIIEYVLEIYKWLREFTFLLSISYFVQICCFRAAANQLSGLKQFLGVNSPMLGRSQNNVTTQSSSESTTLSFKVFLGEKSFLKLNATNTIMLYQ